MIVPVHEPMMEEFTTVATTKSMNCLVNISDANEQTEVHIVFQEKEHRPSNKYRRVIPISAVEIVLPGQHCSAQNINTPNSFAALTDMPVEIDVKAK